MLRFLGLAVFGLLLALIALIGSQALWFQAPGADWMRGALVGIWLLVLLTGFVAALRRRVWRGVLIASLAFAVLLGWWSTIRPSNDRNWEAEVARQMTGAVDPDDPSRITLTDVRNFDWRSPTDFTPRWETRSYDLDNLTSLDLILSYWSGPTIAHTLLSFGFSDGDHVVFSVETRKEEGEVYSPWQGFYKKYEMIILAADERDIIRLRTNARGEAVYLYHVDIPPETLRELFLEYVTTADGLSRTPRFYRTILANCTTMIWRLARQIDPDLKFDWRLLLTGHFNDYLYDRGALDTRYPLGDLRGLASVTARGQAAGESPEYSRAIRAGIPPLPGSE